MLGVVARAIQYTAFFAKLTAHHVVVEEFDPSTNCASTTVVETGFPGNKECLEVAVVARHVEQSDVIFDEKTSAPAPPPEPESDLPAVARKGRF
jgi:hypothetical protein